MLKKKKISLLRLSLHFLQKIQQSFHHFFSSFSKKNSAKKSSKNHIQFDPPKISKRTFASPKQASKSSAQNKSTEIAHSKIFDLSLDEFVQANPSKTAEQHTPKAQTDSDWMRGSLFQEMDRFIRTQRSKHTQRAYKSDLKQFISWLRSEKQSPQSIDALLEYREWLVQPKEINGLGLTHVTANRKFATIRAFLAWLQGRGFIKENPAIWVKSFRAQNESPTQAFSDIQVAKILQAPNLNTRSGKMHSLILHLLFYMGLRRGELVKIKCSDLRQTRVGEKLVSTLRVQGKGDKERILPIHPNIQAILEKYLTSFQLDYGMDCFLFRAVRNNITKRFDQALDGGSISYIVKKYSKKTGIEMRVSAHSCRATAISNALERGATQKSVQHMAGWSSPLMIQRYDKRETSIRDSAINVVDYP